MGAVDEQLIKNFIQAATEAAATVEKVEPTPQKLQAALNAAIGENPAVLASPCAIDPSRLSDFAGQPNGITQPSDEQMATVRAGVTDAFAGVARTGSIGVPVDDTLGSSVSLFCREHVAILDANNLVPRPRDLFSDAYFPQNKPPENFVLITGPSATADMGELVRGVHGPGKLHIILLV